MLKEIRESCKMTTSELSRRSGVHRRDIYNLENNKCQKLGNKKFYRIISELSKSVELAYVAGLVDRASSITITRVKAGCTNSSKSPHYMSRFVVGSKHLEICEIVKSVLVVGEVCKRKNRNNESWTYYAHCKAAGLALEKLLPYLKIKRRKAEILLNFRRVMEDYKLLYQSYLDSGRVFNHEWDQEIPNAEYEVFYQQIREV